MLVFVNLCCFCFSIFCHRHVDLLFEWPVLETAASISRWEVDVIATAETAIVGDIGTIAAHAGLTSVEDGRGSKVRAVKPVPVL